MHWLYILGSLAAGAAAYHYGQAWYLKAKAAADAAVDSFGKH